MRKLGVIATLLLLVASACSTGDGETSAAEAGTRSTQGRETVDDTIPGDDAGRVPNPTVTRATGGHGEATGDLRYDVTEYGYEEHEYLFGGRARTYPPTPLPPARYRSRMIVWTPTDATQFNGTTVVEWAHVSDAGDFEFTVELNDLAPMLEEEGYAFVLVSAQQRGICNPTPTGCPITSLRGADPERYGRLVQPGDAYSFDIFNQALQAIRYPTGIAPLGALDTRHLIAAGFQPSVDKWVPNGAPDPSSSTNPLGIYGPLNAYLSNGADDDARLADGFLIDAAAPADEPTHYRVPTLHHLDESAIRRVSSPDSPNHVTWEVIGAPHVDRWAAGHIHLPSTDTPTPKLTRDEEEARRHEFDNFGQEPDPGGAECAPSPSTGSMFPRRYTLNAALVALQEWVETGEPAPAAPRAERRAPPETSATRTLRRDPDGNGIGGLRLPIIDVPVASYHGEACVEAGTTTPLPPERLAELYPTHESYVDRLLSATNEAVDDRYLLCHDAAVIMHSASASTIGGTDRFTAAPTCA